METPKVRDIMIPVSEYVVIEERGSLTDAFVALEDFCRDKCKAKPHRDVLVTRDGKVVAKLTMLDVLKALEPRYEHVQTERFQGRTLTAELVDKLIREYGLWADPTAALCRKAGNCSIADVMHLPEAAEFVDEDDTVEHALHRYILGVHQPLLVQKDGDVIGVLRLGDVFDFLRTKMTECAAG
ncbi:CBS domain-containing protein [Oleidesulfovibrio sp.]|uniref:CBS domain-containing protein n=1 Tax=Oleidesulfovibrio sp. TaxID=2909707 RepID=UPI003A8B93A3